MNQVAKVEEKHSTKEVTMNTVGTGSTLAPQNLGDVVRFAEVMAKGGVALPKHLRDNGGACMAVTMQALQWEMNPFAVASKSYLVKDVIAYEAQLIAAVVNTRSGIKGRLKYTYEGEGDDMQCTVSGTLDGEECTYTSPPVSQITVKNSPLWKSDPQQQLGYYSARSWARRHCPEVILGAYDRDEIEHIGPDNAKDVTPSPSARKYLPGSPDAPQTLGEANIDATAGFNADQVDAEIETLADTPPVGSEAEDDAPATTTPTGQASSSVLFEVWGALKAIFDMDEFSQQDDPMKWAKNHAGVVMGKLQSGVLATVDTNTHDKAKAVLSAFKAVCDEERSIQQVEEWLNEMEGGERRV